MNATSSHSDRPAVVFIGPPAAGKTKIGKRVARILGLDFVDTDKRFVSLHGVIADYFTMHGEPAFRALERSIVTEALGEPGVLSLGGGAVLDPATRRDLAGHRIVGLTTSPEAVASRITSSKRPLLAGGGLEAWVELVEQRRPIYESLSVRSWDTSTRPIDAIAEEIAEWVAGEIGLPARASGTNTTHTGDEYTMTSTTITVGGEQPYDVTVGRGILADLSDAIGSGPQKVLIIHPPTLAARAAALRESLLDRYEVLLAEIPDAEAGKRIEVAAFCWQVLGQSDFTRSDAVIGFGGGAVTDLAGFVAATWLRGVRLIQVPTTVLGMVDAAIGGKTGINTNEGKNLVGSFYAPSAVVVDLDTLDGLSRMEILAGFGEVVKYGFIAEPEILEIIERDVDRATDPASDEFRRIVELSIGIKARVVGGDFREAGQREILNYGHTLGHAVEYAERYQWRHGAAVAVGMMFAAELGRLSGRLSDEVVDRHRSVLEMLQLPTTYPAARWKSLVSVMKRDKKARGDLLRFIVLDDIARPTVLAGPDESLLFSAYQEVGS